MFLDGLAEGNTDRESMLEFVNGYDAEGMTKQITFDETGEIAEVSSTRTGRGRRRSLEETEIEQSTDRSLSARCTASCAAGGPCLPAASV